MRERDRDARVIGQRTHDRQRYRSTSKAGGEGENRQYKTVLVANEIVLVRSPSNASDVGEAPAPADDAAQPAANAATTSAPKRRRAKQAA